jgi:hypothetical protein
MGAGGAMAAAFLLGGFLIGIAFAPPAYYLFLRLFTTFRVLRESRKERRHWRAADP